jgi:site-specific recombinase XerC
MKHALHDQIVPLFDWLVTGQVVPTNPAAAVRGPKHVVKTGKTPVLEGNEWRKLLKSIPDAMLRDVRDRALIAILTYSFARISAALATRLVSLSPNILSCANGQATAKGAQKGAKARQVTGCGLCIWESVYHALLRFTPLNLDPCAPRHKWQ